VHLIGNVREWTSTPWHVQSDISDAPWLAPRPGQIVVKGSSCQQPCNALTCEASSRCSFYGDERHVDLGFRCAKSDPP
jgi:formylglycine-generating enzyme required for sulfatase activity